jgi:hypothetical protein
MLGLLDSSLIMSTDTSTSSQIFLLSVSFMVWPAVVPPESALPVPVSTFSAPELVVDWATDLMDIITRFSISLMSEIPRS